MIPTFYYFFGFLVYTGFNLITFNTYSKIDTDEVKKKAGLILIYFYYTILAAYVINIGDPKAQQIEFIFQILVYAIAEAIFLWFYHKDILIGNINFR